tara:strand:+ start:6276 stop:8474 length:2199 start_codon:yes stop_codon:yes gene_type:complete
MFKNFSRIFLLLLIFIILAISYLSIFGIKTNKFNELIGSQISNFDNRLDVELEDVFFKLNLKQRSFSLSSKNVKLNITNESQEFANVDILIGLGSLTKKDKKVNKIIINSKENKISKLLKFIRTYKVNIPVLYLENSITDGDIIYNIILESKDEVLDQIKTSGKIRNANLNLLGKEKLENANLDFNYLNKSLEINNININYKNTKFISKKITAKISNNLISVKGDFSNEINQNLISNFINFNLKDYVKEKVTLSSKSNFEIVLSKKFKLKDYKLDSEINFENINLILKDIEVHDFIKNFDNKIILKNGKLNIQINNSNSTNIKFKSKFNLNKDTEIRDVSLNYSNIKSSENYEFYIDLTECQLDFDVINFNKKSKEEIFLNLNLIKNKNIYEIKNLKLYNDKNNFNLNNFKLGKNFKIKDFSSFEAKYYNKNDLLNDFIIVKKNNNIKLISKKIDIGKNIEKSLKSTSKNNLLDIFENLNSSLNIDIKSARLDNDHDLNSIKGITLIKKNKVDKANISGKFVTGENFTYTKDDLNGKKVTTIYSGIAKPFVKKFKFIKGFEDGKLDFTSTEVNKELSNSELRIYDFKVQNMPALTKLLSLASLQGIADLATGEGIRFNELDMFFENSKDLIIINEIYALGPAISILMEGYVEKNTLVSLRGTLVPATTINKTISKIPILGEILVGKKMGEGVFGVSFKIKGPPDDLNTKVNPIKTLTPRFITRTLDKIKKSN